jgi:ThiF family
MALAPYFSRVRDSVLGLTTVDSDELNGMLAGTVVAVEVSSNVLDDHCRREGALLLVNLLARLYPRLTINGPSEFTSDAGALASRINPEIDVEVSSSSQVATVRVGFAVSDADVVVDASGWTATVDREPTGAAASSFATQAAACLGAGELFRSVFAPYLGTRSRGGAQDGEFRLTTADVTPAILDGISIGQHHLAGAGAIGQSCVAALIASPVTGSITIVDPEHIELSNLQRYVLSDPSDVGTLKVDLAAARLAAAGWGVEPVPTVWGADVRSAPGQRSVLVALDSGRDRIAVAAGLHSALYNAFTQPADLGWSRHENYGVEPCLACLYLPDRLKPSDDELIAAAIGQHRLRILGYLTSRVPIGVPLPQLPDVADIPKPPAAEAWGLTSLLNDLILSGVIPTDQASNWAGKPLGALYSDGICGGALVSSSLARNDDVTVPVAHQSALAGIMLAFQAVAASVPELRECRPAAIEGRLDMFAGLPQIVERPRQRTPRCLCSDADFLSAARSFIA